MGKRRYDYIFWDFDGTIMDTFPGVSSSIRAGLASCGMSEESDEVLRTFIGPPMRVRLRELYGIEGEKAEKIIAGYRRNYQDGAMYEGCLFPGVEETSKRFREAGYEQYIATSKPAVYCEDIMRKKGWTHMFDGVFGASIDGKIDTKDEVLTEALRLLGNPDRSQAVLIGDTKYDADGAGKIGIDCVGITYGFGTREDLKEHGACAIFDTLKEAADYIISG